MPDQDFGKTKEELVLEVRSLRRKLHEMEMCRQSRRENTEFEAEDLYLSLIADALFGYYVIQDGRFRFVNPRMTEIFGYTVEEMLEEFDPLDLVHPADKKAAAEVIKLRLDVNGGSTIYSLRCINKEGSTVYIQATISSTIYRGKPAIHGTLLDITDRIIFERNLQQS